MPQDSALAPRRIDLALQGGGAHGAFTWGVLDRLLQEEALDIASVSGASAGAMNAAVLASGLATGGRKGARHALREFWKAVNRSAREANPAFRTYEAFPEVFKASAAWWSVLSGGHLNFTPSPTAGEIAQDMLGDILREQIDFPALRRPEAPQLYLSATEARTGRAHIFRNDTVTVEALLASACLPMAFPPVTIDGVDYWDGGYSANPPLLPLIVDSAQDDLVLVTINPMRRDETPRTLQDIPARISEMTFNESLLKELRVVHLLKDALETSASALLALEPEPVAPSAALIEAIRRLRLHEIHDEKTLSAIAPETKMLPELRLLVKLRTAGQRAAGRWLSAHGDDLGHRSTADLASRYL